MVAKHGRTKRGGGGNDNLTMTLHCQLFLASTLVLFWARPERKGFRSSPGGLYHVIMSAEEMVWSIEISDGHFEQYIDLLVTLANVLHNWAKKKGSSS